MMNLKERKAKLRWQSRRGMLELDIILGRFVEAQLETMPEDDLDRLELLLDNTDPDLYAWLMAYETPSNKEIADFVTLIRSQYSA